MKAGKLLRRARQMLSGGSGPSQRSRLEGAPVLQWNLDYPSASHGEKFEAGGLVVQGWVLFSEPLTERPLVVVRWNNAFELSHGLTRNRPDVIQAHLNEPAEQHPQLTCGFRFTVPVHQRFELLLRLGGQEWLLGEVEVPQVPARTSQALKVIEGREGWLFLDNDTNYSVDQHCGHLMLTHAGLTQWQAYLKGLADIARAGNITARMLVAPAKEAVLGPKYHPLEAGKLGPVDQVLALPEAELVVYPVPELVAMGDASFYQTDTHWTHQGAALAAGLLAKRLGLDAAEVDALLLSDRYKERAHKGDLGSKLQPPRSAPAFFLASFNYRSWVVYDNGLPNFGRVLVTHYPQALRDATCLVFGSSSSYSMFNYLCRFFRRLVFVHSAGNLDKALISRIAPDYLVAQTNARFVVRPPETDYDVRKTICDKQAALDAPALEQQARLRVEQDMALCESLGLMDWHLPVNRA